MEGRGRRRATVVSRTGLPALHYQPLTTVLAERASRVGPCNVAIGVGHRGGGSTCSRWGLRGGRQVSSPPSPLASSRASCYGLLRQIGLTAAPARQLGWSVLWADAT